MRRPAVGLSPLDVIGRFLVSMIRTILSCRFVWRAALRKGGSASSGWNIFTKTVDTPATCHLGLAPQMGYCLHRLDPYCSLQVNPIVLHISCWHHYPCIASLLPSLPAFPGHPCSHCRDALRLPDPSYSIVACPFRVHHFRPH